MGLLSDEAAQLVHQKLRDWSQGDFTLEINTFIHIANPLAPLTSSAASVSGVEGEDFVAVPSEVLGIVVVTQTCDIVNKLMERPYVEVCPIVEVGPEDLPLVKSGNRPGAVYLSTFGNKPWAVDLDRVMTIEKTILVAANRVVGCPNKEDQRKLAIALARKRARFAFPDEFESMMQGFLKYTKKRHGKQSPEGEALLLIREFRASASPSWTEPTGPINVTIYAIRNGPHVPKNKTWAEIVRIWEKELATSTIFLPPQFLVVDLENITGKDYAESEVLDLNYLSEPK